MNSYNPIALGIHWDRLISIADEIVNSLVRTSFSTNVRESYDLSCVVFDAKGRALAQGTYSVPSFTGSAQATLKEMLDVFPADTLRPGDVLATNDPWMGTGHLFDINVMQPIFRKDEIVGYVMSITHLPDIGGAGFGTTAREIYEEGLRLPVVKLLSQGEVNPLIINLIRCNVRVPEQTIGDLMANVACTSVGARMVNELMDEYSLNSLQPLADAIFVASESAMREALLKVPDGVYENAIDVEGPDEPLRLECKIIIEGDQVHVSFDGTSKQIPRGINVPFCYTRAMSLYAIKCLTTPQLPNNEGSVRPITVNAPSGSILNTNFPSPTGGRHIVGHFVMPLIFGALEKALPDKVQADSGMLNLINVQGKTREGKGVSSIFFAAGGFGAMKGKDGISTLPSPSNMTGVPIEIWEDITGIFIESKELLPDSGGVGEYRGGLGQRIVMRNENPHPMVFSCLAARTEFPPLGLLGGSPGSVRKFFLNGEKVSPKGKYVLEKGDTMELFEAGGGGYGDPGKRSKTAIEQDLRDGFITYDSAVKDYGYQSK